MLFRSLEGKHNVKLIKSFQKGESKAVREFICSPKFEENLVTLSRPTFQYGYSSALPKVEAMNLLGINLSKFLDYDIKANKQINKSVDGYIKSYKLEEVIANLELELVEQPEHNSEK